jgi:cytochrome c biogenesis factor
METQINNEEKVYFFKSKRFVMIMIVLIIMWLGLMVFFYLKADEVTKHPCSICAKKMGEAVICTTGTTQIISRTFYPNWTIVDGEP